MKIEFNWKEITEALAIHASAKTGLDVSSEDISITVFGDYILENEREKGQVSEISEIKAEVDIEI